MAVDIDLLSKLKTFEDLIGYLEDELAWDFRGYSPEEVVFEYSATDVGLKEEDAKKVRRILQLRPIETGQPWGVFYLEFAGKLSIQMLRSILRGLVAKKRASANRSEMRKWQTENLLFICTSNNFQKFNFAYFRGKDTNRAVLSTFGWQQGDTHLRTLAQYNLPALRFPDNTSDAEGWLKEWREAFDVEAVTAKFFADYHKVFELVESEVKASINNGELARLYTQRLFNRLMFIYFIQKKGWLSFEGDKNYLRALFNAAESKKENFLHNRLYYAFFWGMSNVGESRETHTLEALRQKRGDVPYLNGGLFDIEDEYDGDRNKVKISNETFRKVLDLFERYNFTVEESTPFNVQVAIDPEMLGKVFEELVTGREARQEAGRYYTPRNIVSFMCRESLKKYLGGYETLIDERKADTISVPEANDLLSKLDSLKVVDPACGSGAYLLGMLHELHSLNSLLQTRAALATARDDYKRKLEIIERNLYGVDKDNLAVQIARFRLWLSLVIEYDDQMGISDLPTLPNLDFKIECGDSLTAPNPEKIKIGSFRTELISQYREAKAKFLSAHGSEKGELRKEIKQLSETIRHEAAFWLYGNVMFEGFDWAIEFAEVFDNGGFDIVLANPPYGATVAEHVRDLYFDRSSEGAQSKDTYGLFIARGLQLLCDEGQLCYIVSDTWRTIKTHKPLRRRLIERTTVWHVLDLPSWVFNATVNTCILTLTKKTATDGHQLIAGDLRGISKGDWDTLSKNMLAVAAHGVDVQTLSYARYTYPQSLVSSYENYPFFIASSQLYKLMNDSHFNKLSTFAEIKQGLITAENTFYLRKRVGARGSYEILDDNKLLSDSEIADLADDEKLSGIDMIKHGGKYFLPYDKGGESEASEGWMPNYFVPTSYFIDWSKASVKRLLTHRSDRQSGRIAARFQNREYYFREGITFSPTGIYSPTFRLGCSAIFGNKGSTIFFKNKDAVVFLGILTSKVTRYLLKSYLSHTVETGEEVLLNLILPPLQPESETAIRKLVTAIIEKQKANQRYLYHLHEQKEIDALIYQLYGLTEDDIREVELWYCRRYSRLAEAQGMMQEIKEKYKNHMARCERILEKPPGYWKSHPILSLIAKGEGANLEFKETLEVDIKTGEKNQGVLISALKTIAAFLNTDGGTLLIGVSDAGEIRGLNPDFRYCKGNNEDGFEQKIRNYLNSHLQPVLYGQVTINFEHMPEGTVCRIDVQRSLQIIHIDNKDVFIRDGNGTRKLEGPVLTQWITQRNSG